MPACVNTTTDGDPLCPLVDCSNTTFFDLCPITCKKCRVVGNVSGGKSGNARGKRDLSGSEPDVNGYNLVSLLLKARVLLLRVFCSKQNVAL